MDLIKQLNYFKHLREDLNNLGKQFIVYKVEGPETEHVYYGYCQGDTDEAMKASFVQHANDSDPNEKRGITELVKSNGGSIDDLEFEAIDVVEDEEKAMMRRNEARAEDPQSITGPSFFPGKVWKAAKTKYADVFAQKEQDKLSSQKRSELERSSDKFRTARAAWKAGFFNNEQMKKLKGNKEAIIDLDKLTPLQFAHKYQVDFTSPVTQAA